MATGQNQLSELAECLRQNSAENAKKIISQNNALLRKRDDCGRLPIHWAAVGGCVPFVELSITENPESMNATDDSGWTPLMIAASAGRFDVCRQLLASPQCDVNHENENKQTALHYAASKNQLDVVKLLAEADANVNAQDRFGATSLHRAASQGHLDVVRYLLTRPHIRIDMPNGEGDTPLHLACEDQNDSVAILLAMHGANIQRQNKAEKTPLDLVKTAELNRKLLAIGKEQ